MEKEITLLEALTGLDFVLTHLDGRKVRIQNKPGDVIKPDSLFTVEGQGMPFHKKVYQHGSLIIQFKIKFPMQVDARMTQLLGEALSGIPAAVAGGKGKKGSGKKEEVKDEEVSEVCLLKHYEEHHRNTHHQGGTQGDSDEEEEEDGHGHGQRIGCQAQ